ncbi:MAG: hypothetical protein U0165_20365 [Polyangiaceae bacterium]
MDRALADLGVVVEGGIVLGYTLPEIAIIAIIFAAVTLAPRVPEVGERLGEKLFARSRADTSPSEPTDPSAS